MKEEDKDYLNQIRYFWQEKGDYKRYCNFDLNKVREIDPVLAQAMVNYELAVETLNRLLD